MRIESVKIENFRQYKDVSIEFKKSSNQENDIHIVLGRNGVGKTNMLNAITWCLYGVESHLGDRNTAIEMINTSYAEERKLQGEKDGEVKVSITLSSETYPKQIIFRRTAKYSLNGNIRQKIDEYKEAEMLSENDEWELIDKDNDEAWIGLVQMHIPQEINEYIFFDGEQLQNYFHEGSKIQQGIKDLTQASLVLNVVDKFKKYVEQELQPKLRSCDDNEIKAKQKVVDDLTEKKTTAEKYIADFTTQSKICEEKINKLSAIISGFENIKEKTSELNAAEKDLDDLETSHATTKAELKKYLVLTYPYFALYPAIKSFSDYIKGQDSDGKLPPKIDKSLIQSILNSNKCCICNRDLDDNSHNHIEEILKQLTLSSATSAELNKTSTVLVEYFNRISEYKQKKDQFLNSLSQIEEKIKSTEKKCEGLRAYIKTVPNSESISKAIDDRDQYRNAFKDYQQKIGSERSNLQDCEQKLQIANKELTDVLQKNKSMSELNTKIEFCRSCVKVLNETANEVLSECREDMQSKTYSLFSNLIWKKDAFKEVKIEEDYSFKLLDSFGNQTLGSCSAAERALLALSFTLALQDVSKHDSMLYIDTPVGRVDDENRANFMETLLNISKNKQVILTFTPTEYDETIQSVLGGKYNSFTKLEINEGVTNKK
ncbi:MAG: AAA family ATPase [Paludibacteraceae bacterium]|nr:AAA family ATPase [Paludibacteraceae bacterium]